MCHDTTVFIVDDDPAVRRSLKWLVESAGFAVEAFDSAQSFLADGRTGRPGCLLLDVRMPGMSGMELLEQLQAEGPALSVVVITGHGDIPMAVKAMKHGAIDFLEKPFDDEILLDRIRRAIDQDVRNRLELTYRQEVTGRIAALSPRERTVMELVTAGKPNKQIATELFISAKTVEAHRANVMRKMRAASLAELVRMGEVKKS